MSGMRLTSGKLTPIKMTEKRAAQLCKGLGIEHSESAMRALADETNDYAIVDGLGFCMITELVDESEPTDWCTVFRNPDNSLSFQAYYYDGGVGWLEFVESTLKSSE